MLHCMVTTDTGNSRQVRQRRSEAQQHTADVPSSLSAAALLQHVIVPRILSGTVSVIVSEAPRVRTGGEADKRAPGASSAKGFPFPPHAHGTYEMCWVVSGQCVLVVGERHVTLDQSAACIVLPGEVHFLRPTLELKPFDTVWWHVTSNGINLSVAGFAGGRYARHVSFIRLEASPVPAIALLVKELTRRQPRHEMLVQAILLQLAAIMLRRLDEAVDDETHYAAGERKSSWHVQRVAQYIEAHHGGDITLEHLASVANLSPYYLTTLFRRYTGRSTMAYVHDVRHREALSLLRETDMEVNEVARRVGYSDPYYFSRVFKALEGCSPLQYRRYCIATATTRPQ
jgi:AraC-like DNA-binding protein/mannose-6-phosphate isomerase-like protein (cupin superfamily)